MRSKDDIALQRGMLAKSAYTLIRLKYALLADKEINDKVPALLARFDAAVARGELFEVDATVLEEVLNALPPSSEPDTQSA